MANWFTNTIVDSVTGLVSGFGDAIDKNVTSDEERITLHNELAVFTGNLKIKMEEFKVQVEAEMTKRWESDNQHGTILARNIRPLTLGFLMLVFTLLAVTDGNIEGFSVKPAYISLLETLLYIVFTAYFTSRGLEHIARFFAGKKEKQNDVA